MRVTAITTTTTTIALFLTTSLLLLSPAVLAFTPVWSGSRLAVAAMTSTALQQSSSSSSSSSASQSAATQVPLVLEGQNIELTPSLVEYVKKRLGKHLNKLAGNGAVRECDVVLSVSKNPKVKDGHRVEVVTNLKGTTIVCKTESPDMYESIDAVAHALYRKLRKYKERRTEGWHGGAPMGDDVMVALESLEVEEEAPAASKQDEEEEFFFDPEKPSITKDKAFRLDVPISVDEAIFALDYCDHDFYVFRNKDTNEINVVYKRHINGGIGLVEP